MDTSTDNKCKEPSFNHFTINTGHNLVQTQQYFLNHPVSNAILKKLAQESLTPEGVEVIENVRACLKSSNKDSDESKSKHLSRNKEFALTIFPKSAEFVEPAK